MSSQNNLCGSPNQKQEAFLLSFRSAKQLTLLSSVFCHLTSDNGGGERDRTDDLLRARQALSQLSYTPVSEIRGQRTEARIISRLRRINH